MIKPFICGLLLCLGFACQTKKEKQVKNQKWNKHHLNKDQLPIAKQVKKQKVLDITLKTTDDYPNKVNDKNGVGLWEYLSEFDRPHQPGRVAIYPLHATTHKAPYGEYDDLQGYHYKAVSGYKVEVITNQLRNAFTPPVNFRPTYAAPRLDAVTRHEIRRPKTTKRYPYFVVLRINGKPFKLSDHLVPDTLVYFKHRDRNYLASAQTNGEAMGTTRQYTVLHVFDVTEREGIKYFELKGRYQSSGLLYDYNGDGVLDYPLYETYLCKGFEPLFCKENPPHDTCGRIYLKSLYPDGWKRLAPYGIYFYLKSPHSPYIFLKECNRVWVK